MWIYAREHIRILWGGCCSNFFYNSPKEVYSNFIGQDYNGINVAALSGYLQDYFRFKNELKNDLKSFGEHFRGSVYIEMNLKHFNATVLNLVDPNDTSELGGLKDSEVAKRMVTPPYSISDLSDLLLRSVWYKNYGLNINDILKLPIPQFDAMFSELNRSLTTKKNLIQNNEEWDRQTLFNILSAIMTQFNLTLSKETGNTNDNTTKNR